MNRWQTLLIITGLLLAGCSDSPSDSDPEPDPEPAPVNASVSAPAQAYTNIDDVELTATCSSADGLAGVTLIYESPDPSESFTENPTPSGNSFSETITNKYEEEGTASLEIICTSKKNRQGSDKASTVLSDFETQLELELRNNATGGLQEGFIYVGDDSIYTSDGNLDVILNDPSIKTIHLGLIDEDGEFGSYLRKVELVPGQNNSSSEYMVDFKFRDPRTKQIIGELVKTGYDYNGPMDITRFLGHLDENILIDGVVPRWEQLDKIVFADTVHFETSENSYALQHEEEADLLFETYKGQHEDIIQPHLSENVPFERVEKFVYTGEDSVDDIVVIFPNSKLIEQNRLGSIGLFREAGKNAGAYINVRDELPDKESNRPNYDILVNRVFLHEVYSALINPGRSDKHTRPKESILTDNGVLQNAISMVDSKVLGELSQSEYIGDNEHKSEYLLLPPGF